MHRRRRGHWSQQGCYAGSESWTEETQSDCLTEQCSVPGWDCCCGWNPLDYRSASPMATDEGIGQWVLLCWESWTENQTDCWTEQCSVPGWDCKKLRSATAACNLKFRHLFKNTSVWNIDIIWFKYLTWLSVVTSRPSRGYFRIAVGSF